MNIKLLSFNEENENFNFEYAGWRHNMFRGPQKRGCYNWGNTVSEIRVILILHVIQTFNLLLFAKGQMSTGLHGPILSLCFS